MILKPEELINQVVGGYQLMSILGRGAAGTVFLGIKQDGTQEKAAIKILMPPAQLSEEELKEFHSRFTREAQVLQELKHPHILSVNEFGEDENIGLPYMVMKYIDGGTLSDLISNGPIPLERCADIVNQIADALDYAHARNVVHRDIKPANVLIDSNGSVYLADFGIVKLFDTTRTTLTTAGQVMGTPEFMAPEQARGDAIGPQSDIYSLGMIIYQMTTSQLPFTGNSLVDVLLQIVQTQPKSPLLVRSDLPKPVESVVMRALDKVPTRRFSTAGELGKSFALAVQNKWSKGLSPYDPMTAESPPHVIWESSTINPTTISHQNRNNGFAVALTLLVVTALAFALWSKNLPNGVFTANNPSAQIATKTQPPVLKTNTPSMIHPTNTPYQQGYQPQPVYTYPTDTPFPFLTSQPYPTLIPTTPPNATPIPTTPPNATSVPTTPPTSIPTTPPGVTPIPTPIPPTAQPLFAPGLISPPSNMTYQTYGPGQPTTVTFQWSTSAPQSDFQIVSGPYGASDTGWLSYTTSISYPLGAGTYSWRVKSGDGLGNQSPWSATWSFTIVDPTPTAIPPTPTNTPCPYLPGGNGVTFYNSTNYSGQSWTWYVPAGQNSDTANLPSYIAGNLGSFFDSNNAWHVVLFQGPNGTGNLGHYDTSVPDVGTYWRATQSVRIYINRSC